MTPLEHWEWLIRKGIIDREGRVICMKLFGDDEPQSPSRVLGADRPKRYHDSRRHATTGHDMDGSRSAAVNQAEL